MAQAILKKILGMLGMSVAVVGTTAQMSLAQGFTGSFAPEQWQLFNNRPPELPGIPPEDINGPLFFFGEPIAPFEGSVDFNAPEALTLFGSNRSGILSDFDMSCGRTPDPDLVQVDADLLPLFCGSSSTFLFVTVPETSKFSFDWDYITFDSFGPSIDLFGFGTGNVPPNAPGTDGTFTSLINPDGEFRQSGTSTVPVEANQIFAFQLNTSDNEGGRAQVTISNFRVMMTEPDMIESVPEPTSVAAIAAIAGMGLSFTQKSRSKK